MRAYHSLQSYALTVSTTWSLGTMVHAFNTCPQPISEPIYPLVIFRSALRAFNN